MMNTLHELRTLDLSIQNITVKAEHWLSGTAHDYLTHGRTQNLMHIITGGSRSYITENDRFTVGVGTLLFIADGTRYHTVANDECSGIGIIFDLVTPEGPVELARQVTFRQSGIHGFCHSLMQEIHELSLSAQTDRVRTKMLMWRLLERLICEDRDNSTVSRQVSPAVDLIGERFCENLSVAEYAAVCHLSESYFRRVFTDYTGMTPLEYRDSLRFAEAHRLCADGMTITQAAEKVGFCDASYMRRLYRKRNGRPFRGGVSVGYV